MGWKLKTLGGATAIGGVGFASATPEMIAAGHAGVAAHLGTSAVATSVLKAGFTGALHAFGQLGWGVSAVAHPITGGLVGAVASATGLSASVLAGAALALAAVEVIVAVGACWLLGKLIKKMWDKAHSNDVPATQRQMPPQREPGLGRSAEKQQMVEQGQGYGTEVMPNAAQTLPRAQGAYQEQGASR